MHDASRTFPVVVFTGGPVIDAQVLRFAMRLLEQPDIRLLAIISESPTRGFLSGILDLWKRRGLLAPAILLRDIVAAVSNALLSPASILNRRRVLRQLRDRIHFVDDIHAVESLRLVKNAEPVLGLVYGGPILRPELYSIPKLGTLGIHHGVVPHYRGKKTTFWAMYNGEPDVGVTIQSISSNLDAGEIVMQAKLSVGRRPLPRIRKELNDVGLDLYVEAMTAVLNGSAIYTKQASSGAPLYKDPTAMDIIRFWGRYLVRLMHRADGA
jgi:hypothetical protein